MSNRRQYERPRITNRGNLLGDDWRETSPFPLLTRDRLEQLEALALAVAQKGSHVPVVASTLAELVRIYTQVTGVAESIVALERLGSELVAQVKTAELMTDSILRGARNRFSVLLQWVSSSPEIVHTKWHEANELRWAGTFEEATEIIKANYGPLRGVQAFVVVRLDD